MISEWMNELPDGLVVLVVMLVRGGVLWGVMFSSVPEPMLSSEDDRLIGCGSVSTFTVTHLQKIKIIPECIGDIGEVG